MDRISGSIHVRAGQLIGQLAHLPDEAPIGSRHTKGKAYRWPVEDLSCLRPIFSRSSIPLDRFGAKREAKTRESGDIAANYKSHQQ